MSAEIFMIINILDDCLRIFLDLLTTEILIPYIIVAKEINMPFFHVF